jgi:hypothetical protein
MAVEFRIDPAKPRDAFAADQLAATQKEATHVAAHH